MLEISGLDGNYFPGRHIPDVSSGRVTHFLQQMHIAGDLFAMGRPFHAEFVVYDRCSFIIDDNTVGAVNTLFRL